MNRDLRLERVLREATSERNIRDIALKVKALREVPQSAIDAMFFEMCDLGMTQYLETERKRFPGKTPTQIMKDLYRLKAMVSPRHAQ
ncbi:MAG: hypothetical protein ACTSU5_06240 [Promethearchaeota archaeon]